jgi:glycosyltransferase involved in cell wall biosynthesis
MLNQWVGPLFLELATGLSSCYQLGSLLMSNVTLDKMTADLIGNSPKILWAPRYDRRSRPHRIFSWIAYTLFITPRVLFARRGDVILVVSNPPLLGPWVWLLTRIRRIPYVILVYDLYPAVLIQAGVLKSSGVLARSWIALNGYVYRNASAIITLGVRMAKVIEQQASNKVGKVFVVPPWVDVQLIKPISKCENPLGSSYVPPDKIVVLYSGNMGRSHDISSILEAALLLREDTVLFFLLIGGGERFEYAQKFVQRHALGNVRVLPWQPADKVKFTLPLGDIGLVTLDEGMEDLMVPSKSFAYMAAGCVLVAIANEPSELSELLSRGNFGVRVAPGSPKALAEVITRLAKDGQTLRGMRLEARLVAEKYHSREVGVRAFKDALAEVGLLPAKPHL